MTEKKVRVKVKKKKIKIKSIIIALLCLSVIFLFIGYLNNLKITNIYIIGNNILPDKKIIELAELENYPEILKTHLTDIETKIKKSDYIKEAKVTSKLFGKIYINVTEEKPLFIYNNKLVLSSKKEVDNTYNINYVPYLKNDITSVFDKFIEKFSIVDNEVLLKISEIEYKPNEIDKERFLLTMIDSNYVYITLSKIEKINKYNKLVAELNNKKGIIYLDSGDYIEIKD